MEILAAILVVSILALLFGLGLSLANKVLAVEKDPLVEQVETALPGVNCGACGYPGCAGYAEAVVKEGADLALCAPGGSAVATRLGELMGVEVVARTPVVARVYCGGNDEATKHKYRYNGAYDCVSADALFSGFMECVDGCIGLGSCVRACKFDAISIDALGNVHIDPVKCTGCGACVRTCPHKLIELVRADRYVYVACSSHEKGAVCNKMCKVSCIACNRCVKACEYDAIHVEDFLARIDYEKCTNCGACIEVCPKNCIKSLVPVEQLKKPEPAATSA